MKTNDFTLPYGCILRQATLDDAWSIRWLVLSAILDPTQLRWQQFWVIECNRSLVACGQLRKFTDTQELGSLVVTGAWRGRGLGSFLTQHLINTATQSLYLECIGKELTGFYSQFGFIPISFVELPKSLQLRFALPELGRRLIRVPVVFMQLQV